MDHHLAGDEAGNSRNGYGRKTVTTETGRIELEIPHDRHGDVYHGFGENVLSQGSRLRMASRISCAPALSEIPAGVKLTTSRRPSVSTAIWRLQPLGHLEIPLPFPSCRASALLSHLCSKCLAQHFQKDIMRWLL